TRTLGRGLVLRSWVVPRIGPALRGLRLVVARLEVFHLPGGLLGPLWVAWAVGNDRSDRQPGAQQRPTLVLLDQDAHRHAVYHLGELARDDVPRHEGELRPGRFIDPDDAAAERLGEGVHLQLHRVARGDAGQAGLLQVSRHVGQVGVVHAQDADAGGGEVAQ